MSQQLLDNGLVRGSCLGVSGMSILQHHLFRALGDRVDKIGWKSRIHDASTSMAACAQDDASWESGMHYAKTFLAPYVQENASWNSGVLEAENIGSPTHADTVGWGSGIIGAEIYDPE